MSSINPLQLSEILEAATLAVVELSAEGKVLSCNQAWLNLLGVLQADVIEAPLSVFVHEQHQSKLREVWSAFQYKGVAEVNLRINNSRQAETYLQATFILMRNGEQTAVYMLAADATAHTLFEQKNAETQLLQRAIINCSNFGMISTDLSGQIKSINATAEQWLGFSVESQQSPAYFDQILLPEELALCRTDFEAHHSALPESNFELLVFAASHGLDDEGEWHLKGQHQEHIPVWLTIKALINDQGELTGYLMIAADLREHKAMQQRLQETEALFRNAFDAAANGIAILDLQGKVLRANAAFFNVMHLPVLENAVMSNCVGATSWGKLKAWLEQLLVPGAGPIHEELQLSFNAGINVWVSLSIALMLDKHGLPLHYVMQMQDITERRRLDAELRLAASVFNSSSEGVYITDQNGIVISVNPAFSAITGWQPKEVIGQHVRFFLSDFQPPEFYGAIKQALHDNNVWQGEIWSRVKNQRALLTRVSITRIVTAENTTQSFVAVFNDITELRQKDDRLLHQAYHDALTDLPNRMLLTENMLTAFQLAQRKRLMVAVLLLDLDHFKYINDTLGHELGDMLLKAVASRLVGTVRESDIVARQGGDEFVILLPEVAELKNVSMVAHKIIESLGSSFHLQGHDLRVSVSIGISVFPQDSTNPVTLIRHADTAMYRAKEQGRNNAQFYTPNLDRQVKERFVMETSLRRALERNELMVYYQPKLDFATGRIMGSEALLRWKHPELGMVPPIQFIPIAEETGLIAPIGDWVLATSCRDTQRWRELGYTDLSVAVNLSARQFRQSDLVRRIETILEETGLLADGLELELTESMIMHNPQEVIIALNKLKNMGMRLSVDDFGTGYSSLSYLKRFPIDTLKIDRSFVNDISTDPDDAAIAVTIINLAKSLRLSVVAEGVETKEQYDFLQTAGCEYMQGYYFSRPIPADEFERLLLKNKQEQ